MSIYLYDAYTQEWDNNGLCTLIPTACTVEEQANGQYELSLTHPIMDDMRWQVIQRGFIIKAPVPAMETPAINLYHAGTPGTPGTPGREIWRVRITTSNAGGYSRIYQKASSSSKVLQKLREGTEYEYLGVAGSNWHRAVSSEGTSGFMYTANSVYVRTESATQAVPGVPGYSTVIQPRQVREQLFRIYDVTRDSKAMTVTARARHVSYDLAGNVVRYACENKQANLALPELTASFVNEHDFNVVTNITDALTGDWQYKSGIEAFLDPDEGVVRKLNAKLVRDNFNLYVLKNDAVDRGVLVSHAKNLMGVTSEESEADVATRLIPIGQDKGGNRLPLPELYVDSAYIDAYPVVRAKTLDVSDAKESDDMSRDQVYEKLREAAAAEYEKGCDLPDLKMSVDFIHLGDTEEYKAYHDLQQVFIFDTVTIRHAGLGLYAKAQINAYTWDCITQRYQGVSIGNIFEVAGGGIAGYQLPTGGVSGTKLVPGSVGSGQLRDGSVLSAKIGHAAIGTAHIQEAAIENANIKDATIERAKIADAAVGYAQIDRAAIGTAHIQDGAIDRAKIKEAAIGTAQIEDASITSAKIVNLAADIIRAVVAEIDKVTAGVVTTNELYAQIIKASVAELDIVLSGRAETTELYAKVIEAVAASIRSVTSETITTNELYAQIIAAVVAEIGHVTAGKIDTNELYAQVIRAVVANIGEVNAGTVQSNELYSQLIMAVTAELRKVTAGEVTTNALYAQVIKAVAADLERVTASEIKTQVIEAVQADINRLNAGDLYASIVNAVAADIDFVQAGQLRAAIAELARLEAKSVDIDYAQIKDLIADEAIISKGIGGNLYITKLAVTEANMVSLTTGELIIKGLDGKFYALTVDEAGELVRVEKEITGDNVADGSVGGEKIIEKSITATQLNVQQIFADAALIGAITAKNLDVGSLFANEAFVGELKTHLIQSDYLSVVISQAQSMFENLSMFFDFTSDALIIRKEGSQFSVRISNTELGFYQGGQKIVYISNSQAYMPKLTITEAQTIGRHRFFVDSNGSMSLAFEV